MNAFKFIILIMIFREIFFMLQLIFCICHPYGNCIQSQNYYHMLYIVCKRHVIRIFVKKIYRYIFAR